MNYKKQGCHLDEPFAFEMLHFLSMKSSEKQRKLTGKVRCLAPSTHVFCQTYSCTILEEKICRKRDLTKKEKMSKRERLELRPSLK